MIFGLLNQMAHQRGALMAVLMLSGHCDGGDLRPFKDDPEIIIADDLALELQYPEFSVGILIQLLEILVAVPGAIRETDFLNGQHLIQIADFHFSDHFRYSFRLLK